MRGHRLAAGLGAAAVVIGMGIGFASPASADQVWHQGVGRASAEAPCPTNTPEETAAGWSEWAPSYAMWPNGGTGGLVCERSITWAKDTPPAGAVECVLLTAAAYAANDRDNYWLYTGSEPLPPSATGFFDSSCTVTNGAAANAWSLVTTDDAVGIAACQEAAGIDGVRWPYGDPRAWVCVDL